MAQAHILHCLRDTFWFLPVKSYRTTSFYGTKATTACADAPQDHECGCFISPAFAYIWATSLFADCMESFIPHQLFEVVVVFSFRWSYSEPFRSTFWNHGRHVVFPFRLFVCRLRRQTRKKRFRGHPEPRQGTSSPCTPSRWDTSSACG